MRGVRAPEVDNVWDLVGEEPCVRGGRGERRLGPHAPTCDVPATLVAFNKLGLVKEGSI